LVGWLVGWLVCRSVGWPVGWSVGWSIVLLDGRLVDCSVGWLVVLLVGLSVGWLFGWLADWFQTSSGVYSDYHLVVCVLLCYCVMTLVFVIWYAKVSPSPVLSSVSLDTPFTCTH
jgi:hypothetical protein